MCRVAVLGVGLTRDNCEKRGMPVVRGGWSRASRDVEIPVVTYLSAFAQSWCPGSMSA